MLKKSLMKPLGMRRELLHSASGHGIFLVGLLLFSLLGVHPPFRYQKVITVNLQNLTGQGGLPGPALPAKPEIVPPAARPMTAPKPKIEKAFHAPTPPKVQKTAPKAVQTSVKKTSPPAPSLSERLKSRLNEARRLENTKKFVEPGTSLPPAASKYRFVEPDVWQSMQAGSGSQTAMSAGGPGGETFPHAWYLTLIQNKITLAWKEPARQMIERSHATAIVSFIITRDGKIEKTQLISSSGMSLLDQSALEAVNSASPLPPLPNNYREGTLQVRIRFGLTE